MNCNSSYNGCSACGPYLDIFYKSNSKPIFTFGEDPFEPEQEFTKYLRVDANDYYSSRKILIYGQCAAPPPDPIPPDWPGYPPGYTCQGEIVGTRYDFQTKRGKASTAWAYRSDPCGNLEADFASSAFGVFERQSSKTVTIGCCAGMSFCDDPPCCSFGSSVVDTKPLWEEGKGEYNGECSGATLPLGGLTPQGPASAITKVAENDSFSNGINTTDFTFDYFGRGNTTLSEKKDMSFFQQITSTAVSMSVDTPSCVSYSLWIPNTYWYTGNKNLGINALKMLVAIKEDNFKEYNSINGTYYLYYGGGNGETPCCQSCGSAECFTGVIVKSQGFSLARNTDNELPGYFVGSSLKINNYSDSLPLDQSLKFCYTIESLT